MAWTEKKKIETVTTYLALGKAPLVEAVTGVPRQTIRIWKMQPWWKDLVKEIQMDSDQELDSKLSKIVDKTLDTVQDRLDNGDFILDSRTGTIKRVPVKMKDAHRVSVDLIDKRAIIRGNPVTKTEQASMEDLVKKLALQFAEFANKQHGRLIEGEVITDAVYEERKEGLQAGTPVGTQEETEPSEGQGGAEQGPQDDGGLLWERDQEGCGPQATIVEGGFHSSIQSEGNVQSKE